ncbi:uncharacterized protein LOC123685997 [Harmonia axyridis]|uniref:uncharacterized protein LOC123685997 n=1 Tax=Harmonia axyridis TaxID=115357 RepID=UPI001E2767C5|nr:uncharacterized protein LOC123685997 [Harmonia axyridis]
MEKWRSGSRRALERNKKATRSGASASKTKKYIYHDQIDLLRKIFDTRATEDSMASENSDQESYVESVEGEHEDQQQFSRDEGSSNLESVRHSTKKKKQSSTSQPEQFELKLMEMVQNPNRHIAFIQGLLPTLENFDDDEVLEFQTGVLQLAQRIKSKRKNKASSTPDPSFHPNQTIQYYGCGEPSTSRERYYSNSMARTPNATSVNMQDDYSPRSPSPN